MTKNDLIAKFHLIKTTTKCCFTDGLMHDIKRALYTDRYGRLFCFYYNDLYAVKPLTAYTEGMETLNCKLGAGYSWYH